MIFGNTKTDEEPKSTYTISIRTLIISVLLLQVLIVAFSTVFLSFKNSAKTTGVLVSNSIHEMNARIGEQIGSYFERPVEINDMNERLIREGLLDENNQAALLKHFAIQIRSNRSVNSIYFGNTSGGLANAGLDKERGRYYTIYTKNFQSGEFSKYAVDENLDKTQLITNLPYFDTRTRPWYINAQAQSECVWSDLYVISTGNDLGLTSSKAVRDNSNRFVGVVGVDLFLSDISKFLSNLDLGIGGQSFIISKSGYLIASSKNAKLFTTNDKNQVRTRIKAIDSESELVSSISKEVLGKYVDLSKDKQNDEHRISIGSNVYIVHVKPFLAIPSQQWLIITAVPEITYLSQIYANNRFTIYLILISLLFSVVLAIILARMISSPILKLDKKVHAISQGEWLSEPVPSRISEIDGLAVEIYKMKSTIQSTINKLNDEISERAQAESFLQGIIDNNPISIQIIDKDGYTIMVNEANSKLFGLTPPPDFCMFTDFQILEQGQSELLARARNGEVVYLPDMHYNVHRFNPEFPDKPIWVKVVIFPLIGKDGKPERFVLMHEDVTGRKAVEAALIAARDSAEENSRLKSSFLANMSHELRTPLSGILGFSELLKEHLIDDVTREMANMIHQSGNRLLNTLNLILDLSQIEANMQKIKCSTFDLNLLPSNVVTLFRPISDKKGIVLNNITEQPKLYLYSDYNMFEHVINELVSNAIKYTQSGSVSVASGTMFNDTGSFIVITVEDTGIGIPSGSQETIFDAFRQVSEGWNRSFEGTGLGLTICKKYVDILGGNITLESQLGKGSKFTLTFPAELMQTEESKITECEADLEKTDAINIAKLTGLPRILLVDDDDMCYVMISKMLVNYAEIEYASTGKDSLDLIKQKVYDAVLLDVNLKQGMSGLDVLVEIQKNKDYTKVPVIAITAYAMLDDEAKFLSLGFTGYISKPFTSNELINAVKEFILK